MNTPDKNKKDQDKDLPGYPHYPASEDVAANNNGIVSLNTDKKEDTNDREDSEDIVMGTEADVTETDKQLLDAIDDGRSINDARNLLDETDNEGDELSENNTPSGLDVPGSELDDADEKIGEEDEENNYYSLGSDNNDNLEESEDR